MGRISKSELDTWKASGRLCFVREGKVYDVSEFASRHPGGEKPLKNNAGRDVTTLMARENPHRHSNNAYKLMEQYYVGEFESETESNGKHRVNGQNGHLNGQTTGHGGKTDMTNGVGNSVPAVEDLVDYEKPVLWQVLNLGEKYYEWTHIPVSRDTMRLFHYDFIEYFSTSHWYAVPLTWIPFIVIICWLAIQQWQDVWMFESVFDGALKISVPYEILPVVFLAGILLWTLLEYTLHRFLFHMEPPKDSKILIGLHFVLHGQHHKHFWSNSDVLPLTLNTMMFFHLMDTMEPWYRHGTREESLMNRYSDFRSAAPFSKAPECSPSSPLIKKLTKIQDVVLKRHDSELHTQLTRLDIQPQIFGIRWIRLLFGREFTLQDLLVLWDTIFADSQTLDLIDYIFVAMLILVRELLLAGDYADCMTLLMRFPMIGDVRCLVDKALHLRDPKKYPRPANYQFQILQQCDAGVVIPSSSRPSRRSYSNGAVVQGSSINSSTSATNFRNKTSSVMTSGLNSLKRITTKGKQTDGGKIEKTRSLDDIDSSNLNAPSHPLAASADLVSEVKSRPLKVKAATPTQDTNMQSFSSDALMGMSGGVQRKENQGRMFSKSRGGGKKNQQRELETDLYQQVAVSQGKMNDLQNMCRYCATKMEAHLMQVQDEMVKLKLTQEDELLLAVAGLKQVKDILKGTLKFAQGMEEQEDLKINDDYYGKDEEHSAPTVKHIDESRETYLDNDKNQPRNLELENMYSNVGGVCSPTSSMSDSDKQSEQTDAWNSSECNNNGSISMTTDESEHSCASPDGEIVCEAR